MIAKVEPRVSPSLDDARIGRGYERADFAVVDERLPEQADA